MAGKPKNNPAEDLMASLLKDVGDDSSENSENLAESDDFEPLNLNTDVSDKTKIKSKDQSFSLNFGNYDEKSNVDYEKTRGPYPSEKTNVQSKELSLIDIKSELDSENVLEANIEIEYKPSAIAEPVRSNIEKLPSRSLFESEELPVPNNKVSSEEVPTSDFKVSSDDHTVAASDKAEGKTENIQNFKPKVSEYGADDKTVAVTGFHKKPVEDYEDKVKVSIGQNRSAYSPGYAAWGGNGSESSLGQAENLRIAQEKILDLEKINETLRFQNEELISASDIIKERSDLLTAQITEYQNDKQNLEESFKNEIALLRAHVQRKDADLQKAQLKIDDLDSRLKFDMKKIRIRERELENRLELIRAEKNTLTKSKDDQILDLRRKMDIMQMEVDSYRQKCVDLNKNLETNQDSFKRTTRALRLAMANLELQEENKPALKKVD